MCNLVKVSNRSFTAFIDCFNEPSKVKPNNPAYHGSIIMKR